MRRSRACYADRVTWRRPPYTCPYLPLCPYAAHPPRHSDLINEPISITLPDGGPSIGLRFQIVVFNWLIGQFSFLKVFQLFPIQRRFSRCSLTILKTWGLQHIITSHTPREAETSLISISACLQRSLTENGWTGFDETLHTYLTKPHPGVTNVDCRFDFFAVSWRHLAITESLGD